MKLIHPVARLLAGAVLYAVCGVCVWAQAAPQYPSRPIRLVVPTSPGGGVDTTSRLLGQQLTEAWNRQVVIDNRGGASGIIGTEIVARAPADGYTLLMVPTTFAVNATLFRKLPYDPRKDFAPISLVSKEPNVLLVHPSLPVDSLSALIQFSKRGTAKLNFGYGGIGSSSNLSAELLKLRMGLAAVGVSYKSIGPAVTALLAGEVQMMFVGLPPTLGAIKAGKLRALAITSKDRSTLIPDVPTMSECGIAGFEVTNWIGMMAPAGTPADILRKLNAEVVRILAAPETKERLLHYGVTADSGTPEAFGSFLSAEISRWAKVVREAGLPVN